VSAPTSDPEALAAATDAVAAALNAVRRVARDPAGGSPACSGSVRRRRGLPFVTRPPTSVLGEDHPNYIGMYVGRLMGEPVRAFVESCVVVMLGARLTDGNRRGHRPTDLAKVISSTTTRTSVGSTVYRNVEIADILEELSAHITKRAEPPAIAPETLGADRGRGEDPITADASPTLGGLLSVPGIITDTGMASLGLALAQLTGRSFTTKPCGRRSAGRLRRLSAPQRGPRIGG
jgi:indolepyruvate decarboxylase